MVQFPVSFCLLYFVNIHTDWTWADIVQRQGIIENPINAWGKNTIWCSTYRRYPITITASRKHRTRSSTKANTRMGKCEPELLFGVPNTQKWNDKTCTKNICDERGVRPQRTFHKDIHRIEMNSFWIFRWIKCVNIRMIITKWIHTEKLAHIK